MASVPASHTPARTACQGKGEGASGGGAAGAVPPGAVRTGTLTLLASPWETGSAAPPVCPWAGPCAGS